VTAEPTDGARSTRIASLDWDYSACTLEAVPVCNLCGGRDAVEVSRRDRYGFPARCEVCSSCGLARLSPRLTSSGYAEFYRSVYRPLVSAYHGRRIDADTVRDEQKRYAAELVDFLRETLPDPPKSTLDVGGSTGVVAAAICDAFGSRATVADPAPDELAHAAAAGMETVAGFAEDLDLGDRTFDLVLLCQTIDHLLDVNSTLRLVRRWVGSGGHAFVDVLDVDFVMARCGGIEGAAKIDHPFMLTRDTALAFFRKAGLRPRAERLADDGHIGFVLDPVEAAEPDWEALRIAGNAFLQRLWQIRAVA
jgi:SAM-dependent methyltransferase